MIRPATFDASPTLLKLRAGEALADLPEFRSRSWRLVHGVVLLSSAPAGTARAMHWALPGDLLGLELPFGLVRQRQAWALTDCSVHLLPTRRCVSLASQTRLLTTVLEQHARRCATAVQQQGLKSAERIQHLLELLRSCIDPMPKVHVDDIGRAVDCSPQTVMRTLARLPALADGDQTATLCLRRGATRRPGAAPSQMTGLCLPGGPTTLPARQTAASAFG